MILSILLACAPTSQEESDCVSACGLVYSDACWSTFNAAHAYGSTYWTQDALVSECEAECSAASEAGQGDWASCVAASSGTCDGYYQECGESPCLYGQAFLWSGDGDWRCE